MILGGRSKLDGIPRPHTPQVSAGVGKFPLEACGSIVEHKCLGKLQHSNPHTGKTPEGNLLGVTLLTTTSVSTCHRLTGQRTQEEHTE